MEASGPACLDFPKMFAEVCLGHALALDFCAVFLVWSHQMDDFIDGEMSKWTAEQIVRVNLEALLAFATNPFWQAHKASLLPLVIQGAKAFADSNRWAKSDNFRDRATADVLKAQYQEVFWHVAKIVGGYDHMDAITRKYRHYHYDARG